MDGDKKLVDVYVHYPIQPLGAIVAKGGVACLAHLVFYRTSAAAFVPIGVITFCDTSVWMRFEGRKSLWSRFIQKYMNTRRTCIEVKCGKLQDFIRFSFGCRHHTPSRRGTGHGCFRGLNFSTRPNTVRRSLITIHSIRIAKGRIVVSFSLSCHKRDNKTRSRSPPFKE